MLHIHYAFTICSLYIRYMFTEVPPLKLHWFLSTIEAFWGEKWALMDFQCALES